MDNLILARTVTIINDGVVTLKDFNFKEARIDRASSAVKTYLVKLGALCKGRAHSEEFVFQHNRLYEFRFVVDTPLGVSQKVTMRTHENGGASFAVDGEPADIKRSIVHLMCTEYLVGRIEKVCKPQLMHERKRKIAVDTALTEVVVEA